MERLTAAILITGLSAVPVHADPIDAAHEAQCIDASARYNQIPAALLQAIRRQEGGRVGGWHVNPDASVDYGVMQINSRWLPLLTERGYTASVLTYDACASIAAGAWILAQTLADDDAWNRAEIDGHLYWRAVGDYHSHMPRLNRIYAEQVWTRYRHQNAQCRPSTRGPRVSDVRTITGGVP
ncbi:MAG: trbN [Nevskia sp.]|nr:trbN [Nevskia sp.]